MTSGDNRVGEQKTSRGWGRNKPGALAVGLVLALHFLSIPARADSYDDDDLALPQPDEPEEQDTQNEAEEDSPLAAGSLAAPAPLGDSPEKPSEVEQELREAEAKDSGRGLEFAWLTGELGVTTLNVTAFGGSDFLADGEDSSATGLSFGGGVGVRLLYFTLGVHVRGGAADAMSFWGVSGGASVKLPLGKLEPYAALDLGYLGVSGLATASSSRGGLSGVGGFDVRCGIGADYYFSNYFSLGVLLGADVAFLGRPAYDASDFNEPIDPVYQSEASATGGALSASLVVGFHL